MENFLEIFSSIFLYSRVFGLAPFTFTKDHIKASSKWTRYSYFILFLNFIAQILNQKVFIFYYDKKDKLKYFSRLCNLVSTPLNSIVSPVVYLYNNPIFNDLKLLNQILLEIREKIKLEDLKFLKFISFVTISISITIAITLPLIQCNCTSYIPGTVKWYDYTFRCSSLISRCGLMTAMCAQFITHLFVIRFIYQAINNNIKDVKIRPTQRKISSSEIKNCVLVIKNLRICDYKLKDLMWKINKSFGTYNLLVALNSFVESNYVVVYEHIFEEYTCQSLVSNYWIIFSVVLMLGSLAPPVLLKKTVSTNLVMYVTICDGLCLV